MPFWTRKQPDDTKRAGFGIFFLFFLIPTLALVIIWKKQETVKPPLVGKGVQMARISNAVQSNKEVAAPAATAQIKGSRDFGAVHDIATAGPKTNTDEEKAEPAPHANALDMAAEEATQEVKKERPRVNEGSLPRDGSDGASNADYQDDANADSGSENTTTTRRKGGGSRPTEASGQVETSGGTVEELVAYRRPEPKVDTTSGTKPVDPLDRYRGGMFLPRAFIIPLYLLDTVRTDQPQPIVRLFVARDVFYGQGRNRRLIIPMGTLVLGSCEGSPDAGSRVTITVSSFQYLEDGTEAPVSGVIRDLDGATGARAYYIPPPTWVQLSSYVNDFLSGYINMLYLRQTRSVNLSIGGVGVSSDPQQGFNPKNEALSTTSQVITDFAKKQMTELQARYAPYLYVVPGTELELILTVPFSAKDRGYGVANGIVDNLKSTTGLKKPTGSSGGSVDDMVSQILKKTATP